MKKIIAVILALAILILASCSDQSHSNFEQTDPFVESTNMTDNMTRLEAGIYSISKYGNIILTIGPDSMGEYGYEPADIICVKIGDAEIEMPIGTAYSDVDSGEPVCVFKKDNEQGSVTLAINAGNLASALKIAEIRSITEDPGYEVVFLEGFDRTTTVYLSMIEKQGYAEEYLLHQLTGARSNKREDYPDLSDAEYANFRAVNTAGMGTDTLFRSSSPVNPKWNRNKEADAMVLDSLIRTIVNMADTEETMKAYPDYHTTNYSKCDIITLNMGMDFQSDDFKNKLVSGFRYMVSHEGPYLIHCNEGKDRSGIAIGILECLMGADADEIVADYMQTYVNYYGIEPDSEKYVQIAESNIKATLAKSFGIKSIDEEGVDLAKCASDYLNRLGMSEQEILALKDNLRKNFGNHS